MHVSQVGTLEFEGPVIAADDTFEEALILAILRTLQFTHAMLKGVVGLGEAFADGSGVARAASNVVVRSVGVDDAEFVGISLVVCPIDTILWHL